MVPTELDTIYALLTEKQIRCFGFLRGKRGYRDSVGNPPRQGDLLRALGARAVGQARATPICSRKAQPI